LNPNGSWNRLPKQFGPWVLSARMVPVAVTLAVLTMPDVLAATVT
jgi:hypothetical protein